MRAHLEELTKAHNKTANKYNIRIEKYLKMQRKVDRVLEKKLNIESEFENGIILCARMECREFATKFHEKLPRELRDMVYAISWESDKTMPVWEDMGTYYQDKPWMWSCNDAEGHCRCFAWGNWIPWALHEYVGAQVAQEAMEVYYRSLYFRLDAKNLADHELHRFLYVDHFHFGMQPLEMMHRLEITIPEPITSPPHCHKIPSELGTLCKSINMEKFQLTIKFEGKTRNARGSVSPVLK
ncbi:hypothetical protein N0V90_009279 [Kalmusia sp. IMI 367209]|nr:hypothetical protein N0V90_009279 [Kalmusia sp. IMI 367209]